MRVRIILRGAPIQLLDLASWLRWAGNGLQVVQGQKMSEGAGVRICRTVGTGALRNLDPYLMLDELKLPADQAS